MRRWIFILISILTLSACHSGGQKDDALSDVDIKVGLAENEYRMSAGHQAAD